MTLKYSKYTRKNNEQDSNTISDTPSIDKQEQSYRNEQPTSDNRNTTQPDDTTKQHRANSNIKSIKNLKI